MVKMIRHGLTFLIKHVALKPVWFFQQQLTHLQKLGVGFTRPLYSNLTCLIGTLVLY